MARLTYSVAEAAEVLGVSKASAYSAVRNGTLRTVHLGGRILIPKVAVDEFLAGDASIQVTA